MGTSLLETGALHQRHSRVPTNDATSNHRLHSIERRDPMLVNYLNFTLLYEKKIHDSSNLTSVNFPEIAVDTQPCFGCN